MVAARSRNVPASAIPRGVSAGAIVLVLLQACASRPPYDPFKTSAAEVRQRVRTIAIAPLSASPNEVDVDVARAEIEANAAARLRAGGYEVVPSAETERVWRRAASEVGGVFDPVSGEVDEPRREAVQAAIFRDLAAEHQVDAILYLRVAPLVVYLPGSSVVYCGLAAADPLYWPIRGTPSNPTLAVVLCLNAVLVDGEGRELYGIRHGLEAVETYAQQTRAVRPVPERLRNPVRLNAAVEATLGPLAGAGRPAP